MKFGRLLKKHTHDGADYPVGAKLVVDDQVFNWLVSQKVMEPIPGAINASEVTPPPPVRRRRGCCGW